MVLVEVRSTEPGVRDPQWTVSCAVTSSVLFPGILPLFPHPSAPLATTGPLPAWVDLFWTTHKSGIATCGLASLWCVLGPLGWAVRGPALPGLLRARGAGVRLHTPTCDRPLPLWCWAVLLCTLWHRGLSTTFSFLGYEPGRRAARSCGCAAPVHQGAQDPYLWLAEPAVTGTSLVWICVS